MTKQKITVIPLGPGAPELLTLQAAERLQEKKTPLFLRTRHHPVAQWLTERGIPFQDLDEFYDKYEDFDQMHEAMAAFLWQEAARQPLRLGVMDPASDGAIASLRHTCPQEGELQILSGVSAEDVVLSGLPGQMMTDGLLQRFSATRFLSASYHPENPLLIIEIDSVLLAGQVKLKLGELYDDEQEVCFFPPSEKTERVPKLIPLYQLDSQRAYDHTSALYLPGVDYQSRRRFTFQDLTEIVARLRAPDGCPWDRVQTHETLRPYMVEEAWEAVNAIEDQDMDHLADELGDVLFQVMIHASVGETFDEFSLTDVISGICRKMIHRHPHVFQHAQGESAEEIAQGWEAQKRAETGSKTVGDTLNDVSTSLPALKYSIKMYKKLAQLPALRRNPEEIVVEIQALSQGLTDGTALDEEKMSQLLMKCTELCYRTDQDAEILLHRGVERMKQRYQKAEKRIYQDQKEPEHLTLEQLNKYMEKEN
ncbi:MAG: MazG family protein [Clostridia bacterium]|nr:MazG family protein [Clostridia bacterium]